MFEPNLLSMKVLHVKHFRLVCLCLKKSFQAVWQIMVCSQDYLTLHFTCLLTGLYQRTCFKYLIYSRCKVQVMILTPYTHTTQY